MHTVLVVEAHDHALRQRGDELLLDGYEVLAARAEGEARRSLANSALDATILGQLESPVACLALLRDLRAGTIHDADPRLPVLALGADSDQKAARLYQAGADISLPTTASPLLIKGALEALATRTEAEALRRRMLRVGQVVIDVDAREASVGEQPLSLTRLEFDLLQTLAGEPHRTFRRTELTEQVWGYDPAAAGVSRTLDSHAVRLRQKLAAAGAPGLVRTVRGVGYRLGH
jgi:DNA-binding response OmpR family regulator